MKLICQKCQVEIKPEQTHLEKGIAQCASCHEVYKIASLLESSQELKKMEQPPYSKIEVNSQNGETTYHIPHVGWTRKLTIQVLITLVVNIGIMYFFFFQKEANSSSMFFPFLVFGCIGIGAVILQVYRASEIKINNRKIEVKVTLFGYGFPETRQLNDLQEVKEEDIFREQNQVIKGIALYFQHQKKLKLGRNLNDEEIKWMIGEIKSYKAPYYRK